MSYSVIRLQKFKGSQISGIERHNKRIGEKHSNKDIDQKKSENNYDLIHEKNDKSYSDLIQKKISERYTSTRKIRTDAVKNVEFLCTSDSEFFDSIGEAETKRYFELSKDFLENIMGKENILYAQVHMDESTPHMHIGFVPLSEGKLRFSNFFNGKKDLENLQSSYNKMMNENGFDLERGKKSDKKHLSVDDFKKATFIAKEINELEAEKENLITTNTKIQNQTLTSMQSDYELSKQIQEKKTALANNSYEIKKDLTLPEKTYPEETKTKREGLKNIEYKTGQFLVPREDLEKMTEALRYVDNFKQNYTQIDKKNSKLEQENKTQKSEIQLLKSQNETLTTRYKQLAGRFSSFLEESGKRCQERWEDGRTKFSEVVSYAKEKTSFSRSRDSKGAKKDFDSVLAPHYEKKSAVVDQPQQEIKQTQIERRKTQTIDWES
ncbi:MobV family relaxase (plasmid) [Carnobacterium maltaromaticum]|uniref:MobV family relaxase n=1 Tax=Carnobacterium maltaromaticum TaxID=2751 RepID=UPI00345092F4